MINRTIAAAAACLPLLAGCATTGTTAGGSTLTLTEVSQDAILAAQGLCAVAPTLASITSIVLAAESGSATTSSAQLTEQTAVAAANLFCAGVSGKAASAKLAGRMMAAKPRLLAAPVLVGDGVYDYGTITIGGRAIAIEGAPVHR